MIIRECEVIYRTRREPGEAIQNLTSSADVYRFMGSRAVRAAESMWVVLLDSRQRVLGIHEAAKGGVASCALAPADVFRAAIVAGARAVVLVHNHPSDDPTPSGDDLRFTEMIVQAGDLLGVHVLDHIVISESGYFSMLDAGLLKLMKTAEANELEIISSKAE